MTAEDLPAINATLNGISTVLLIVGYRLIKRRRYAAHGWTMGMAFGASTLFLIGYLAHKFTGHERTTRMIGLHSGWLKTTYFAILIPHLLLAIAMVPMILTTFYRAWRRDWIRHRRLAIPTFWIWLYVSVTGVIIYWMLYHLLPAYVAAQA